MHFLFVTDALSDLRARKDSSVALMRAAARAGDTVSAATVDGIMQDNDGVSFFCRRLSIYEDNECWYKSGNLDCLPASRFDAVLMRKEPPVDATFAHAALLLQAATAQTPVFNAPRALREMNEKLAIFYFPQLIPKTIVSARPAVLTDFHKQMGGAVFKPLDGMGGQGVYVSPGGDKNLGSVLELLGGGRRPLMAQQYLPQAATADCRVFLIDGAPAKWMLARIPPPDDYRGNLAAGARPQARPLGKAERDIAEHAAPRLTEMGILFAGLDVIGDKLTEINITCPTGLSEVRQQTGDDLAEDIILAIKKRCP